MLRFCASRALFNNHQRSIFYTRPLLAKAVKLTIKTTPTKAKAKKAPKKGGGGKPGNVPIKKVKMKEQEFAQKMEPIVAAYQHLDNYELPDLYETVDAIKTLDGKNVIEFDHCGPIDLIDIRPLGNERFRSSVANKIRTIGAVHGVFPSIVDGFLPRINLVVRYREDELVYWGNEFGPKALVQKPKVKFSIPAAYRDRRFFSLILVEQGVDSDHEKLLWFVSNINGRVDDGKVVVDYIKPQPLVNGGLFRYVFLLLSQPGKMDYDIFPPTVFKTRELCTEHSLTPKGIAFCHSKWHPSVECAADRVERLKSIKLTRE